MNYIFSESYLKFLFFKCDLTFVKYLLLDTSTIHFLKFSTCLRKGLTYQGTVNKTKTGKVCQRWDYDSPHDHSFNWVGEHNYCRNPVTATDHGQTGAWCYTVTNTRWEPCDIRDCTACDEGKDQYQ